MWSFFKCWVRCFVYWKDLMFFWLIGLVLWYAGECRLHTVVVFSCAPYGRGIEYKD